ncbi:MAG: hypothetical protein WDZ59_07425 [Pirellulales bacterium]
MTARDDHQSLPDAAKPYRLGRRYLVVGIVCSVFFAAVDIGSVAVVCLGVDGIARLVLALFFGLFWSSWLLLSVWLVAAYFREKLFLQQNSIVQHGIFRTTTLGLAEVWRVRWRPCRAGGTILAWTHWEKVAIPLINFTEEERAEIISYFRENFSEDVQEDWPQFMECVLEELMNKRPISRRRLVLSTVACLCIACFFIACWWGGLGAGYLLFGLVNAIGAIGTTLRLRSLKNVDTPLDQSAAEQLQARH